MLLRLVDLINRHHQYLTLHTINTHSQCFYIKNQYKAKEGLLINIWVISHKTKDDSEHDLPKDTSINLTNFRLYS